MPDPSATPLSISVWQSAITFGRASGESRISWRVAAMVALLLSHQGIARWVAHAPAGRLGAGGADVWSGYRNLVRVTVIPRGNGGRGPLRATGPGGCGRGARPVRRAKWRRAG